MDSLSATSPKKLVNYGLALDLQDLFLLGEQAFREEIGNSLKAAKASRKPLLVMFLAVERIIADRRSNYLLRPILSSLASSLGKDVSLGWYRSNRVLGIIPEATGGSINEEIDACTDRIGACLAGFLDADEIERVRVIAYVITGRAETGDGCGLWEGGDASGS